MMMNVVSSWIKNNVMEIEIINLIFAFHFQAHFHAVEIFLNDKKFPFINRKNRFWKKCKILERWKFSKVCVSD